MKDGIYSIVITEPRATNPNTTAKTFSDTLIAGSKQSWLENTYQHEIRAMGGLWSASFNLPPNDKSGLLYLEEYFTNGLGRHVEVFIEGGRKVWEGYIDKMVLNYPAANVSISLASLANKVWIRYLTSEGGIIKRSTTYQSAESQARYGVKEMVLQGAIMSSGTLANRVAQANFDKYRDPFKSIRVSVRPSGGNEIYLEVHCKGYFHTLNWRTYNQTATAGTVNASTKIGTVVTGVGEFIRGTYVETNTSQVDQLNNSDELAGDLIMNMARIGDTSINRFVVGCYEGRVLRYEQAKTITDFDDLKYNLRIRDQDAGLMIAGTGRKTNPAEVRPNNWAKIDDIFAFDLPKLNIAPSYSYRTFFVESVRYREPDNVSITSNPDAQIDNLLASSGFGGASTL